MPMSYAEGKDWSAALFERHRPETVTDIGPGEGTYAKLLRPLHHGVWWTAVEVHKPYVRKYGLKNTAKRTDRYDEVHVLDARQAPAHLWHRDLVIAGDVLEHMPRADAVELLHRIVDGPDDAGGAGHILVSVPIVEIEKGPVNGNPSEEHVHHWDADDMDTVLADLGCGSGEAMRGETLGVWWWSRN